jgi:hypothetical protein
MSFHIRAITLYEGKVYMELLKKSKIKFCENMIEFLKELNRSEQRYGLDGEYPHYIIECNDRFFSIELLNRDKIPPIVAQLFSLLEVEVKSRREEAMKMLREIIQEYGCFVELTPLVDRYFQWKKESRNNKYEKCPWIDELMEKYQVKR